MRRARLSRIPLEFQARGVDVRRADPLSLAARFRPAIMTRQHPSRAAVRAATRTAPDGVELALYDLFGPSSPGAVAATLVREARRAAGLSKAELGRRAGVPEQVVALWEDPTWEGHSMNLLHRVARALELRLELRFAPTRQRPRAATEGSYAA
jgi:DNA-binding transcriptional regulator YiaG